MIINIIIPLLSLIICLTALIYSYFYIHREYNRISNIINEFMRYGKANETDIADTRESKLISQLNQLLRRSEYDIRISREEKETVTRLISDLSHQLKTPLSNIKMYSEILKEASLSEEEKKEFILRLGEQSAKMEWLLNTLFKISRLENGIIEFEASPAYIKETIADSINAIYGRAESKNIKIIVEEYKDRLIYHNRKWTTEALLNILENAVKYSPEQSLITIAVEPMELFTKIEIKDQGIGIPNEEYNLIFKRFYRGKKVDQKEGNGLGLYLTQLILSKQGGYVTVNSKIGEGSCFSVFLQNTEQIPNT